MSDSGRIVDILWAFVERFGNKVFSVITLFVLIRLLDPKDFGTIAIVRIVIDYLELFVDLGVGSAVIQKKNIYPKFINTAFWFNTVIGLVLTLFLAAMAPIIANFMGQTEISEILLYMSVSLFISGLTRIQVALLIKKMEFKKLAIRGFGMSIVGGIVGIVMALNGWGVWSIVAQQLVSSIVGFFLLWYAADWRPSIEFDFSALKEIFSFSNKLIIEHQVTFFSRKLDEMLIVFSLGTATLGYYSIAKKVLQIILDVFLSVVFKINFALMAIKQENKHHLGLGLLNSTCYTTLVLVPIFLVCAVLSTEIIDAFFGNKWMSIKDVFSVLMISGVFLIIPNILQSVYLAVGKPVLVLKSNLFNALLGGGLLYVCMSFYGLLGVALAVLIKTIMGSFIDGFYIYSIAGIKFSRVIKLVLRAVVLCVPMLLYLYVINEYYFYFGNKYIHMALIVSFSFLVYLLTLALFQKKAMANIINRFI